MASQNQFKNMTVIDGVRSVWCGKHVRFDQEIKQELSKQEQRKAAAHHSYSFLPEIVRMMNRVTGKDAVVTSAGKKGVTNLVNSKSYKRLLNMVKKVSSDLHVEGKELYAGVCGIGNVTATANLAYLLICVLNGQQLKWDQPHNCARHSRSGDLMGFIFGIGHPWEGRMVVFEIDQVLGEEDREPHWSNIGYRLNTRSNSQIRGCLSFKRHCAFGRWTASGTKTKQGFTHVKTNRHEYVF
jgi:hypothetical protein